MLTAAQCQTVNGSCDVLTADQWPPSDHRAAVSVHVCAGPTDLVIRFRHPAFGRCLRSFRWTRSMAGEGREGGVQGNSCCH